MGKKTSPIWTISKEEFIRIYHEAKSIKDMLSYFGLESHGNNNKTLQDRLKQEGLSYGNLSTRYKHPGLKKEAIPLEKVLVENSSYYRGHLKRRIINKNLIPYICDICKQEPIWKKKKLVLILDHINGIHNDNRLENLRFLCPNCNSQTSTFAGKNTTWAKKDKRLNQETKDKNLVKRSCKRRKVKRPTHNQLKEDVQQLGYVGTGKKYSVSDNAIRKWIKFYEKYHE
jgi:5-methylcytosine-specific restriction endonuclease McrA